MAANEINTQQFEQMVAGDIPVLVDFWAPWCTYCRKIHDAYDSIAEEYADKLRVVKINIDENPELAQKEKIEIIPTLRLYQSGKMLDSVIAPDSKAAIETFLGGYISVSASKNEASVHDMIVIGGGPAGYTTALYAVRAGMEVAVLEKLSAGGQMALTHQIDNYPGFENGIDGFKLSSKMEKQAKRFGAKSCNTEVLSVDLKGRIKRIHTSEGDYLSKTVVFATGAIPKKLGLPGEDALLGKGVAYCAACDGFFYKGRTVVVIGGGNTAAADAILLSRIAEKVILVHRRDKLRATQIYHKALTEARNIEIRWNSVATELLGDERVTGIRIKNTLTNEENDIRCDGVFVSVGREPASQLVKDQLEVDASGYILAGEDTRTSIDGVYAVGDVRTKQVRQIVTAVADGAVAAQMAEDFLASEA